MCLINAIGLRDCGEVTPTTGKYVNDLPGISTELAQKISDKEQGGFYELWQNVQRLAVERFNNDFLAGVSSVADFKGTIFKSDNLRLQENALTLPIGNAVYKGAVITLPSNRAIKIDLDSLQFVSNTALTPVSIVAIELLDQTEYWSDTIDVIVGKNTIDLSVGSTYEILPKYENSKIFVGVDCENIELKQDRSYSDDWSYYCDTCNENSIGDYFSFRASWVDKSTFVRTDKGGGSGVAVVGKVSCNIGAVVCDNLSDLSEALRYLLGYMLLEEKTQSKNANIFTYFDPDATEALKMAFAEQYEREIKQAIERIDIKDYCFTCQDYGSISDGYLMP